MYLSFVSFSTKQNSVTTLQHVLLKRHIWAKTNVVIWFFTKLWQQFFFGNIISVFRGYTTIYYLKIHTNSKVVNSKGSDAIAFNIKAFLNQFLKHFTVFFSNANNLFGFNFKWEKIKDLRIVNFVRFLNKRNYDLPPFTTFTTLFAIDFFMNQKLKDFIGKWHHKDCVFYLHVMPLMRGWKGC